VASIIKVNGKWRALVRRKGHRSICRTHSTKAAAEAWGRMIEAQIDAGKPVAEERSTVADLIDEYRRLRDASRPVLDTSTEHYTLKQLKAALGEIHVARLTPQDLVGYCTMRRDEGAGPYTCNMDISKLATVLRYAGMSMGLPATDVVGTARPLLSHLGLIGGGGRRERRPTADELQAITAWLAEQKGELFAEIVRFAVATAMRRGEIERLLWADVDEKKRLVLVRDRKDPRQKKGNDQWVPLLGTAWTVLQRQVKVDGEARIFPIGAQTVSKYFTEACLKLGVPDLHFHDLRHEGTSKLFEEGYEIQQVALVTGHKDWRHLRRYTNLKPEDLHR
jgi:integrase